MQAIAISLAMLMEWQMNITIITSCNSLLYNRMLHHGQCKPQLPKLAI